MTNPLLANYPLPAFDEIRPEHIEPAMEQVLSQSEDGLKAVEAVSDPTWASIIHPLEAIDHRIGATWGAVGHLMGVKIVMNCARPMKRCSQK